MQETSDSLHITKKKSRAFQPKDRIDHAVFGLGTIVSIDERHTTIAFDQSGTRKFVTSMVRLAPSKTPAPARRARTRQKAGRSSR